MNDLHHPCEPWAEPISLAAAGCLSPDEQQEVRRHIETCPDCRERFQELTRLCAMLTEARLPADNAELPVVERVMSAVASEGSQRPLVHTGAVPIFVSKKMGLSPLKLRLICPPDTWRRIMRSPVSRIAAAVIIFLAVTGVALWLHSAGTTPALANFIEPILEAKTVKYKETYKWTSLPAEMKSLPAEMQKNFLNGTTTKVMMLDADRTRMESEIPTKTIQIWDGRQGKSLDLLPDQKRATIFTDDNRPKDKTPNQVHRDAAASFRALLLDARDKPGVKREPLGEKEIDGRRVVGVRISFPAGVVMSVWGDPKTGLPARIETISAALPNLVLTQTDFEFNVDMDESLFSVEPPAGYELGTFFIQHPEFDPSTTEEKDLIETFRESSRLSGGRFPAALDMMTLTGLVYMEFPEDRLQKPGARQEINETQTKLQRGLMFSVLLPKEADAHYAGKGVSLGEPDKPIFWYRPKDGKRYRVIYADLSVREAETPPTVSDALPEKDLIDALRHYSELSGGPFPDALDIQSVSMGLFNAYAVNKPFPKDGKYPGLELQAEMRKTLTLKLMPGLNFANSLPPEANVNYAGKRVSFGAADTPIFWYRPKDSKKYRVIYADLSVREADAPPIAPVMRPEQDLIDMFRCFTELSGGPFPNSLNSESIAMEASTKLFLKYPTEDGQQPRTEHLQGMMKFQIKLQPGLKFTGSLPPEADAHYAGRGVSVGATDKPIFWYRPKDTKKYRIIYADLSVRDADTPPNVPVAPPEQDLIDSLRYLTELNDGIFPDSFNNDAFAPILEKKFHLAKGQKPNAKQTRELQEIGIKLSPGEVFIQQLPPDADAHYAGKGVSLGAADTPIFWYRPKDSKKYRVIYADLSVRDADAPPNVPKAQPVPAPSSPKK
jgi:outer membrane lipoprotein-sorting protein